ncbi:CDP-alcohol phosphatidyltransferase family protein [Nonomuraea sp. NPDC050547]|uniref:CDP-alcohol phosphatidyltransferase family protein n=1 Tax=unclassified Nonomuraea TaxID=2593643 RepID=UPI0037B4FFBB
MFTLNEVRERTYKPRDAWWTVFLVDPLAGRLVVAAANRTSITPNQVTWAAFALGLGSAACFVMGDWSWVAAGAVLYHLSFVLDCVDGKIARLKGTGTVFGGWLDYVFDRIRVLACSMALMWGQYRLTGQDLYLILGILVVFLDMLRYVDAFQVAKVRRAMRRRLDEVIGGPGEEHDEEHHVEPEELIDLQRGFRSRFSWYMVARDWLRDHRVRTHLMSGIEFQMAVFIVGPLLGLVVPVTLAAAGLLLVFEVAIMYKLWLSSRDLAKALTGMRAGG